MNDNISLLEAEIVNILNVWGESSAKDILEHLNTCRRFRLKLYNLYSSLDSLKNKRLIDERTMVTVNKLRSSRIKYYRVSGDSA